MMVHSLCAVGNFHQDQLQVAPLLVALQNQVVLNRDAHLSYLDVARHFLQLVVVDAELRHLMRKDYFQDVVWQDVEQPGAEVAAAPWCLMRKDYFQDEEQQVVESAPPVFQIR
jgi:hypothetical protein